jgi:hypothetical protein
MRVGPLVWAFLALLFVVMNGQAHFTPWQLYTLPLTPPLSQHAMCKYIDAESMPIDRTDRFSIFDKQAVSWLLLWRDKRMHSVEWRWYSPEKREKSKAYAQTFGVIPPDNGRMGIWSAPIWSSLEIAGQDAANMFGLWKVDVIVDYKTVLTEYFTLDAVSCWGDFNCGTGQICCNGVCYAGECCLNSDCTDLKKPICDANRHTCECNSASCGEGQVCYNGACYAGECCSNMDCTNLTNPICDVSTHTCECNSTSCGEGQVCYNGACYAGECCSNTDCTDGKICCDNQCTDLTNDTYNCGACSNACHAYEVCTAGSCVCDSTHYNCDGDLTNGCEKIEACVAGDYCIADSGCANSCCIESSNKCADLLTDESNCGTCSNACTGATNTCCGGSCVTDLLNDSNTCLRGKTCERITKLIQSLASQVNIETHKTIRII